MEHNEKQLELFDTTDATDRMVQTLAEDYKDKKMTRKVDTYEYEDLAVCIRSDQVPASEIAELFTDKAFYKWYSKRYFNKGEKV